MRIFYAQYHLTPDELKEMSADEMKQCLKEMRKKLGEVVLRDTGRQLEDDAEVFLRFSHTFVDVDLSFPPGSICMRMTVER